MLNYPIVNDQDEVIGQMEKEEAYEKQAMLRSAQLFLYDQQGRLFIQRRAWTKKRFPGCLCASVAGHVEPKEGYEEAIHREMLEEIGIDASVTFVMKTKTPIDDERFAMMAHFRAVTDQVPTRFQEGEVAEGWYVTPEELQALIDKGECFTPSFHFFLNQQK
ncbi:hypothetical protein COV05_04705 [Candidatus Uhrbacteria bacterium CG10_big_fil_rev_8_21_14_0_10_48_16]|uniref:Nudix hydrolase domain-containing protein n=1 Tax=Candidatus Uhrbacteria bacterium CG10_big_fil_rev_8_21_14_0_10_48_16 TaxID=1975038 RepID=A0A2M8LG36_9BACT|nr:MAG: hypothetical protein COV05_04705 [Candidatus Uhrbacteria bacterium CG10_big_fil_rev_8_21_14_0_10_48_16]